MAGELIIVDFEQGSREWAELRRLKRTASLTPGVMRTSKWIDPLDVYEHYHGTRDFVGNAVTDYGNRTEPRARACLEIELDVDGNPAVGYRDDYLASLDFLSDDGGWNIDIKSPFAGAKAKTWKAALEGVIEPGYADQLEHQHRVFGTERNGLFVYLNDKTHRYIDYTPNDQRWGEIRRAWDEFFETYVNKKVAPNLFGERSDPEFVELCQQWLAVHNDMKLLESAKATIEEDLKKLADGGKVFAKGLVRVNTFPVRGSIDYAKMVEETMPQVDAEPWRKAPSTRTVISAIDQPKKSSKKE